MFAVTPKYDCKHIKKALNQPTDIKTLFADLRQRPCIDCGDTNENWWCITCHKLFCSRYVNGHMMQHFLNNENHPISISMTDLSVWCNITNMGLNITLI